MCAFISVPFPKFPKGADYILSHIQLIRLSFVTRYHLVSEPPPYPYHNGRRSLAADCPFRHCTGLSFMLLPYLWSLSRAMYYFHSTLGNESFRGFPNNLEALRTPWSPLGSYMIRKSAQTYKP